MSTEQMREEFETLYAEEISEGSEIVTAEDVKKVRDGDSYMVPILAGSWWAWQASRAAVVVKLPDIKSTFYPNKTERARAEEAVWWCKNNIEAAGLKVEP